jgi:hypothetical protein
MLIAANISRLFTVALEYCQRSIRAFVVLMRGDSSVSVSAFPSDIPSALPNFLICSFCLAGAFWCRLLKCAARFSVVHRNMSLVTLGADPLSPSAPEFQTPATSCLNFFC